MRNIIGKYSTLLQLVVAFSALPAFIIGVQLFTDKSDSNREYYSTGLFILLVIVMLEALALIWLTRCEDYHESLEREKRKARNVMSQPIICDCCQISEATTVIKSTQDLHLCKDCSED